MKSNIPKQTTPAIEEAILNQKAAERAKIQRDKTLHDFRMGSHAVAKLAINTYEELIKNSTTFEELQLHTNDLLDQLRWALNTPKEEQEVKQSE